MDNKIVVGYGCKQYIERRNEGKIREGDTICIKDLRSSEKYIVKGDQFEPADPIEK